MLTLFLIIALKAVIMKIPDLLGDEVIPVIMFGSGINGIVIIDIGRNDHRKILNNKQGTTSQE